jgi:hypothetical protein
LRFTYSEEQIEFLREGYEEMRIPELTVAFNEKFKLNKGEGAIKTALKNRKFTCGRKGLVKGERSVLFTKEQVAFIKEQYKIYSPSELTIEFNKRFQTEIKVSQVISFVKNQGIQCGRNGQFGKGHVSWNKGIKGYMGPNVTSFLKGHVPPNRRQVGDERICSKDGYILIKVEEPDPNFPGRKTRWKGKHIVVWEKVHGPVPKDHIVIFLDGDKTNCDIDNLMMISRAVNAYVNRHGYADLKDELKKSSIAMAKVIQKASLLKKRAANPESENLSDG